MRRLLSAGVLLGLVVSAQAQQPPADASSLTLRVSTEEAMLIVQTLGAIGCQNVTQLAVCQRAADLLKSLREQLKAQGQ